MNSGQCRFFAACIKRWSSNKWQNTRRIRRRKIAPMMALGAVALMGNAFGWAEEEQSAQPTALPEVVITGNKGYNRNKVSSPKYTEPLRNIPQTITVIPKEVIQDQGATSMRQVLRNVPGISMQAGEGGVPAGDNLTIRGFNARTDFFIDGMRDLGGYFRDPFNMEQVEVTKGPSSSTSGRGSTGGSINQVSKQPALDTFLDASAGIGTDQVRRGTVDYNAPIKGKEGTAVRLNALWHESDVARRDEVNEKRWGIAPSIAFGLGTPTRLTLSYYKLSQDSLPDYGIPWVPEANTALPGYQGRPAPVSLSNFYGLTTRDYERTDSEVFTAALDHSFNDSISVRNIFRAGDTKRDSVVTSPRFVSNSTTTINRQFQSRDQEDDVIANQTDVTIAMGSGGFKNTFVLGAEFSQETQHNFLRNGPTSTTDLFEPTPNQPTVGLIYRNGTDVKAEADSTAFSAFNTMDLGGVVQILFGIRAETFDVAYTSRTAGVGPVKLGRTDNMLSGRIGVVVKPSQGSSIYAGYGNSFNPSAEGLTSNFNSAVAIVKPEKSNSYEIGAKADVIEGRLSMAAAVFRTDKDNARTPGINAGDPPTILDGKQRVEGAEVSLAGNITRLWQLFAGYTSLDSEIRKSNTADETGKRISNTPKDSYNVWTTYQFPKATVGAGAQYVGKRYANNTNTRGVDGYTVYDAMASFPVNEQVTLRVNVNNITDKEYFDRLGGGHLVPGAGRSASLTTEVKF
jgi:catecholate siderophore receptor